MCPVIRQIQEESLYLRSEGHAHLQCGWDADRYGTPGDIIAHTDRTTLWAIVCAAKAFNMPGVTEPCELYQHIHLAVIVSRLRSGMGGMESLARMFKDRREDKEIRE